MPRGLAIYPALTRRTSTLIHDERSKGRLSSVYAILREIVEDMPHFVAEGDAVDPEGLAKFAVGQDRTPHRGDNQSRSRLLDNFGSVLLRHSHSMPHRRSDAGAISTDSDGPARAEALYCDT